MAAHPAPTFLSPAVLHFDGDLQGGIDYAVPWVISFDHVDPGTEVCVLTTPQRHASQPGMYVLVPTPEQVDASTRWKFALSFREVCAAVATAQQLDVWVNVDISESYPPGYTVWLNGHLQDNAEIDPVPADAVWVVGHVPTSGGGGGGGSVALTMSNIPGDLPATSPGDPAIQLTQDGTVVSKVNTKELFSIGGVSLGLTINGVNRA